MAVNIIVPELSESVVEATVSEWLKKEGDKVEAGDIVVVLETDKVSLEVTADAAGVISRIDHPAGDDVTARTVLGVIEESGAGAAAGAGPVATPAPTTAEMPTEQAPAAPAQAAPAANGSSTPAAVGETGKAATPVAQRVAAAHGVDITQVPTTGGKVTKEDVEVFVKGGQTAQAPAPASAPAAPAKPATTAAPAAPSAPKSSSNGSSASDRPEQRQKMSRRRQAIARNLLQAQSTAAMLTTFNEIDMSAVMEVRSRRKEAFQKKFNVGLGFSSFFVKATIGALKAFPLINAEIQENEFVIKQYYDIGIAIGAEEGLVVPVLRNADKMSFAQIEQQIKDYAQQSRDGSLGIESLMGGTFTITNGGVFGSLMSTPILNPPQVGILGLHAIKDRPIVVNGEIVARPMMYVALTYDHRIVDGREAVQFLVKVKELIEDPEALLIEG
jgi:2-oxoglutarate dehydrogenase E2 component (dihydrolipoamide succinyltransferase)